MYANDRGVIQDDKEAVKWYRLAAEQGQSDAQYNLGLKYAKGQGVIQDYKEAVRLFGLAAAQGNAQGRANLALAEAALAKQAAEALAEARNLAADGALQEAEAQAQVQAQVKDAAECESFGAAFGSPAYVQCRISLKALRQGVLDNQKTAEQDKTRADFLKVQSEQQQRQAAAQQAAAQQAAQRDDRALLGLAGALLNGINNAEAAQKARLGVSTSCDTVGTHTSCRSN
jgi:TPR repeat protein